MICGYVKIIKFDGRKRFIKTSLVKNASLDNKIYQAGEQNLLHINIDNNIDSRQIDFNYINKDIREFFEIHKLSTTKNMSKETKQRIKLFQEVIIKIYCQAAHRKYLKLITYEDLINAYEQSVNYKAIDQVAYMSKCLIKKYRKKATI